MILSSLHVRPPFRSTFGRLRREPAPHPTGPDTNVIEGPTESAPRPCGHCDRALVRMPYRLELETDPARLDIAATFVVPLAVAAAWRSAGTAIAARHCQRCAQRRTCGRTLTDLGVRR